MLKSITLLVPCLLIAGLAGCQATRSAAVDEPHFDVPFQAVLLDTGLVYYGKISGLGGAYPILRNVYYIQTSTDPQSKQVNNVLIRRGNEFHGPEFTVLAARHIVMIEPVGANSKVAQLIAEQEKKK
jgi:hypothetical protein